jgi:hypothetical protein
VTDARQAPGIMTDYHHVAVAASIALHLTVMLVLLWPVPPAHSKRGNAEPDIAGGRSGTTGNSR